MAITARQAFQHLLGVRLWDISQSDPSEPSVLHLLFENGCTLEIGVRDSVLWVEGEVPNSMVQQVREALDDERTTERD